MKDSEERMIGRRVREIRTWRGLSQKECAELAGLSESYLSRIESGHRPVARRQLLEALATALRVAPSELAEQAFPAADQQTAEAQSSTHAVEAALADLRLGTGGESSRSWPAVAADLDHLCTQLRPVADYASQGRLLPGLLQDLHQLYVTDPEHRTEVLQGLVTCYQTAAALGKGLGVRGLPSLAAVHARQVSEELDDPAWLGLSSFVAASTAGGEGGRSRMLTKSLRGAQDLEPHLGDHRALQVYGMLHLCASLSSATMNRYDNATAHLNEARQIAERTGPPSGGRGFGQLYFGPTNVRFWEVSVAVEMGEAGRAKKTAEGVRPEEVQSKARQAMFYADLGCGLAEQKADREDAVRMLLHAEELAPQRIRTYPLAREIVGDLMRRARREAISRDLRGLGHRMGLSVH